MAKVSLLNLYFMINEKLLKYFESYLTDNRKALFKKVLEDRTRHFTVVL
ncbi:MAG: tRNA (guanosine-2'-O-)-methyltransferase, partial [Porticoccaceae bacterium]